MNTTTNPGTAGERGAKMAASKTMIAAQEFAAECAARGFRPTVKVHSGGDPVVTVETSFPAGDRDAYVAADGAGPSLLCQVPRVTYGSTWGTDGASVGGHAGMTGGYYYLSVSGVSKRFASALAKVIAC